MSDLNRLCDVMREMKYGFNVKLHNSHDSDMKIYYKSRIDLIEVLLIEAKFIRDTKDTHEIETVEDVGC